MLYFNFIPYIIQQIFKVYIIRNIQYYIKIGYVNLNSIYIFICLDQYINKTLLYIYIYIYIYAWEALRLSGSSVPAASIMVSNEHCKYLQTSKCVYDIRIPASIEISRKPLVCVCLTALLVQKSGSKGALQLVGSSHSSALSVAS